MLKRQKIYKKIGLIFLSSLLNVLPVATLNSQADGLVRRQSLVLKERTVKILDRLTHQFKDKTFNKQLNRKSGSFQVVYAPVNDRSYQLLEQVFKESQIFEILTAGFNETFVLPTDITVVLAECGQINAFYTPEHQAIVICYELVADFAEFSSQFTTSDEELFISMISGTMFVFLHELGHALIHVLNLPTVGREEDAADQLATLIATEAGDTGEVAILVPAFQYFIRGLNADSTDLAYWDEHSLDLQRFYNIICLFYGSNPNKYAQLAASIGLPESRAQRCPGEYQKAYDSWNRLLEPHLKRS